MKEDIIELFGRGAAVHFNTFMEPILQEGAITPTAGWFEYGILLFVIALFSIVTYKFSENITRILQLTFSFPMLVRQINSINRSLDVMARVTSSLLLILLPMVLISHKKYYDVNLFENRVLGNLVMTLLIVLILAAYIKLIKSIFYRTTKNRFFYRKLFFAERICLSAYTILIFPVILLTFVDTPYQNSLVLVQFLLIMLFYMHYLITDLKLFIEEKVSYVQLILYFCTVKVVIVSFIIYFGIFVI